MINLKVDEAYAFDYFTILFLKKHLSESCLQNWESCYNELSSQISNFNEILDSKEYQNLLEANKITFDAVNRARYGQISAKEVDEANMLRHKRKQELQKKFFYNNINEYKT